MQDEPHAAESSAGAGGAGGEAGAPQAAAAEARGSPPATPHAEPPHPDDGRPAGADAGQAGSAGAEPQDPDRRAAVPEADHVEPAVVPGPEVGSHQPSQAAAGGAASGAVEGGPEDDGAQAVPDGWVRAASDERRAVVLRPPSFGAVEARGLVKFFGTTAALRGCDLMVLRGERVALLGANGAGKTTLLKLLATLLRPSAGYLTILGLDAVRQAGAIRRQIGVVAHETYLYRDLTAAENLRLYGRLYGVADLEARIGAALARVGLADLRERRVGGLSRGQQQRLALARALLHGPSLLLLDEPDTGLDEAGQALLAGVVREAAATVILATHSVARAVALADRVVVLAGGRVAYEAPIAALDPVLLHKALGGAP